MTRSSRHKSHKQSKHSSRDAREHSESESESDVKMKERNGKEEGSGTVCRDSVSSEKRKDLSGHANGDASEDYVGSKRRKEKADLDRWNSCGDEMKVESSRIDGDKTSKSKALVDSKSKSSRKHDGGGGEKKEESVGLVGEKEESKSSSKVESKRKSEKDLGRKDKDSKEKERVLEKKIHETEVTVDGEERQGKRGRENTELSMQDEVRNLELEKELDKRIRKRRDGSSDKEKYQDKTKESEDRRLSLRGEHAKDVRYKDEKHKDGSYGDKHREDGDRDNRHRDDKYREDGERDSRHRDVKYREDGDRDNRHRDNKYREDGERDSRHKDDKYREDGDRDNRRRDDKYREDGDRDNRHRDDKYLEDGDRDARHRDDKFHEDGDRDYRHKGDKYREDGDRDDRHRDDRYLEDGHREGKQRDDNDKDKRLRDVKYRDKRSSRDHTSDKSDIKRLRDESNATKHHRKSNNRDGSPIFDDRSTINQDDKGRRRTSDKEDDGDMRSLSTKEQHSAAEKKYMSSARVESVSDKGRSNSRNADVEITPIHSRRRSSPSSNSHAAKDHYRVSKQEESKYRDYVHDERVMHGITTSKEYAVVTEKASQSRSIEKPRLQKDNCHLGEVFAERRLKEDKRSSPLQMVDKSPSSTSADRRHLNRSDVRRSLDIEDSGQRSGGSKDVKDYSGREGRGSRDLPMETLRGDEVSQADGDNLSESSPFSRTGHLSSNSRSLLPPPPPYRLGPDSPLALGSLEDDNRGKSNNRHRRIGDPNMGRAQGSPWRGVPNWPSPVANGFIPFQHGPPPVGFHPVMQQFPPPPMFSIRPSMELNQSGVPYHVPDGDRFSSHGRSLGWRNLVDESCPPIHGWDANNTVFGDESHIYGRLDWDHHRRLTGSRLWETRGDIWKGQNSVVSTELPSAPQKDGYSAHGPADDVWTEQTGLEAHIDKKQPSVQVESVDIDQSSDALERNTLKAAPKTIPEEIPNLSRKDGACLSHVYLSMVDISPDLTQPELYSQYTDLMGMKQNLNTEEADSKLLLVEEAIDATVKISNKTSSALLFPTINDSVLQKAMSLYKKLREEARTINGDKLPFSNVENLEAAPALDLEVAGSNEDKLGELVPACGQQEAEVAAPALTKVKMEVSSAITNEKINEPDLADALEKPEGSIAALNKVKMELNPVPKQETLDYIVEVKSSSPQNVETSDTHSPGKVDEVNGASDSKGNCFATIKEGQKFHDANKCASLLFSDVSTEACEAVIAESIESGSVNLSRIHQSPESTH
ncbi:hypothetical protein ACSBR1_038863 [Camellia fascicularis]